MKKLQSFAQRRFHSISLLLALIAVLCTVLALGAMVAAGNGSAPPFDFNNAFYRQNGVNPDKITNRRTGADGLSVFDTTNDPTRRNVRVTITIPAYDHSGAIRYWNVFGELFQDGFTNDAAGEQAKAIANSSAIFVFPKRSGNPLRLGNNRQADMIDLRNGYFSNNRLGLWLIVFVNYTDRALNTSAGQKTLNNLAQKNGRDFDGTPIIRTLSDMDNLLQQGLITRRARTLDGSQGPIWSLCPVIKDPRGGAIAPDAFLAIARGADGRPLPAEAEFERQFRCLQTNGDWCN